MAEQLGVLCYTTVAAGGYTAGSGVLNVASTSTGSGIMAFPTAAIFTVTISDPTTKAAKAVLKVTGINSATQFAVTASVQPDAQSADVNCVLGDLVQADIDGRALNAILSGTWAALPYQNGYSDLAGGYQAGEYSLAMGGTRVFCRGVGKPGTTTFGTTIVTAAVGFRPTTKQLVPTIAVVGGIITAVQLDINTNGTFVLQATATAGGSGGFVSFNFSYSIN